MNFWSELCPLKRTQGFFFIIWPSDLIFDPTCPSFKLDLGLWELKFWQSFMDFCSELCPLCLSKIWPSDLVFWPNMTQFRTWPNFIKINILTKFHEDLIKTVASRVYTSKRLTDGCLRRPHMRWTSVQKVNLIQCPQTMSSTFPVNHTRITTMKTISNKEGDGRGGGAL